MDGLEESHAVVDSSSRLVYAGCGKHGGWAEEEWMGVEEESVRGAKYLHLSASLYLSMPAFPLSV